MDRMYDFYFSLPNFKKYGLPGKVVNKALEMALKRLMDSKIPSCLQRSQIDQKTGLNNSKRDLSYIVSLTSFPGRINEVWTTIETLLRQSVKPDKIVLWLSEVQFPDRSLPQSLLDLKSRGLEIEFVKGDIRSHKKYFYAFQQYPNAAIITVDDDVYYPKNTLKYLIEENEKYPDCIIANRSHMMTFENGKIRPYRKWEHNKKGFVGASYLFVPTGVGGVLYPPKSYHADIFDEDTFKEICFMADDLWLKVATLRNNTSVITTPYFSKDLITVGGSQKIKLVSSNSMGGGNDVQLKSVLDHFNLDLYKYRKN